MDMESLKTMSRREIYQQLCWDIKSDFCVDSKWRHTTPIDENSLMRTIASCKSFKEASSVLDEKIRGYLEEADRKREEESD